MLASAAVALMLAAAAVALVERLAVALAVALALAGASIGAVVSLAPESGATVAASQLRNWSPVYRQQAPEDRIGDIEDSQSGYKVLHTKDSQYHRIAVVEDDTTRYLRFDSSFQSGMYVDDPYKTRFEYSDYLQLPFAYRPSTKRVLYIGLGGGSALKRTWRDFPSVQVDGVEIDPEVVDVAYEFFELPRDPRLKVAVEDGRRFLAENDGPWDVIVDRRLLLRLDPVPPRDARVPRARTLAARSRRPDRHEHHRSGPGAGLAPLPLDAPHVPRCLPGREHPSRASTPAART